MLTRKLFTTLILLYTGMSFAAEQSTTPAPPPPAKKAAKAAEKKSDFSWQAMMGMSMTYDPSIIKGVDQHDAIDFFNFAFLLDVYYKGFFIQSNHRRADSLTRGAELGYQIEVNDDWELDVILKNYLGGYEPEELIEDKDRSIPTLEGLAEREEGNGLALRYSHFLDDAIFTVDAAVLNLEDGKGWLIETFYSHLVPYRNWDIYFGGGVTYYSSNTIDYYYGVDNDEVSDARMAYRANSGFRAQLEVFMQYPLSRNWSFNAAITQKYYSNSFLDSPIIDEKNTTDVMMGVLYVF